MASGPPSPETVCGCCDAYTCVSSVDNFQSFVKIKMSIIKGQKKKLISKRDSLKKKIEEIKKTERVINDAVLKWLNDVEKLIQEEENLKKETLTHGNICFCFPGTMVKIPESARERRIIFWNYNQIAKEMKKLNTEGKFEPISSPCPGLEHFASGNFVCFKSTKEASDRLLEALHDDSRYIIGLYGKQGSGKTTLVKAMGEKVKHLRIFGVVLFASVSQNPDVRRIQDEIAESLNLRFDKISKAGRARKIHSTLESMSGVLVILDDVGAKVELEDIGIPSFACNANQNKILLTTCRRQECALMECQMKILLDPLSQEETWTLFKKHSDIDEDESSSSLLNVAHEVANECKGLPGVIEDVGCSLKSKPIEEWRALLDSLKHSMARYHIFLSFRGEDTRYSFTGSLYNALCQQGFKTFMDDGELRGGDQISVSILKAIEESRLSIIVLSENYAYSSWCLDELVKILECMKTNNQLVWPIFYKVEPSDIRRLRNGYGEAIAKHEQRFGKDSQRVQKWKSALSEISNLSGKPYKTGYEYEYKFIQKIVEDANNIKNRLYIRSTDMD